MGTVSASPPPDRALVQRRQNVGPSLVQIGDGLPGSLQLDTIEASYHYPVSIPDFTLTSGLRSHLADCGRDQAR
ncbi:MAG: hypothetical protein NTU91_01260, partial [Chloroflexi bacterium]|nr:hypothetical protein [Chloroflexota bacterium]